MRKIELSTSFTPWTLDCYQTFTFDDVVERVIEDYSKYDPETGEQRENLLSLEYDDFDWDFDNDRFLKDLAGNWIDLINDNATDDVIKSVTADGNPVSPKEYNFYTDRMNVIFEVDGEKLDQFIESNREDYEENKLKDRDGFWWFGDEDQTRLNYYLRKVSHKLYDPMDYYYDQVETVDPYEYVNWTLKK